MDGQLNHNIPVGREGFMKKWHLECQIVTKIYLPSYLCDSSDGNDSSDSNDSIDSCDSTELKTQNVTKLNNSKYEEKKRKKIKMWQNPEAPNVTKLKN